MDRRLPVPVPVAIVKDDIQGVYSTPYTSMLPPHEVLVTPASYQSSFVCGCCHLAPPMLTNLVDRVSHYACS